MQEFIVEDIDLECMSFSEAMQNLVEGKEVARKAWEGNFSLSLTDSGFKFKYPNFEEDVAEEKSWDVIFDFNDITKVDWFTT